MLGQSPHFWKLVLKVVFLEQEKVQAHRRLALNQLQNIKIFMHLFKHIKCNRSEKTKFHIAAFTSKIKRIFMNKIFQKHPYHAQNEVTSRNISI